MVVGDCAGGEGDAISGFPTDWDSELAVQMVPIWLDRGYMAGALLDVNDLIAMVDTVVRSGATVSIPSVTVAPRPPAPAPAEEPA